MPEPVLEILLVEDNPNDVMIARRAFSRGKVPHHLHVVQDGQAARDFLSQLGKSPDSATFPRPDLILLDLNLPRVDGFEVLRLIKSDQDLKTIPVVILTTSEREVDVHRCYQLGANTYIPKPVEFDRFLEIVSDLHTYWWKVAKLPARAG